MICVNCRSNMIWQNDFDFSDCGTLSENYIPVGGIEDEICED